MKLEWIITEASNPSLAVVSMYNQTGFATHLQSIIGGAVVDNIGIAGITHADGDVLRVECDGTRIQAYVNGRMVYALNSALNLTGKLCGLQLRHPTLAQTVMVDDFMVHKLS